jgi:unsaturated rhamnogalacturonyl hydrolase
VFGTFDHSVMMKINFACLSFLLLVAGCATPGTAPEKGQTTPLKISGNTPLDWSCRLAESEMAQKGRSLTWTPGGTAKWDYAAGLFELSLVKLSEATHDKQYEKFAAAALGSFLEPDGTIHTYHRNEFQLDALNSGRTAMELWHITHDDRYESAAMVLRQQLLFQPRTPGGGFWHKLRYTNQMWLDGIYMALPFYAEYGKLSDQPEVFDDVARQFRLIDQHTYDPLTGLNYHGWDAAKIQPWANPATGCSSNFWGRAEGWYAMALVDVLDYFPTNHPGRAQIIDALQKTARGILKWQDPQTGLWWQVMDQGGRRGNYREATASAMFVYALAKGVNHGYLPRDYIPAIEKGYAGVINNLVKPDGDNRWSLTQCCSVAGLGGSPSNGMMRDGSFDCYVGEPVVSNDLKGIGPFILAGIELQTLTRTNIQ